MEKISDNELDNIIDNIINEDIENSNNKQNIDNNLDEELIFDENKIPDSMLDPTFNEASEYNSEILKQRKEVSLGISPKDIKDLYDYVSGNGSKPLYVDKFTADATGHLKDMVTTVNLVQLSSLPMLIQLQNEIRERLFNPDKLVGMDAKDLMQLLSNLNKETQSIINSSVNAIQAFSQFSTSDNQYNKLLDRMILMPEDKIKKIIQFIENEDNV